MSVGWIGRGKRRSVSGYCLYKLARRSTSRLPPEASWDMIALAGRRYTPHRPGLGGHPWTGLECVITSFRLEPAPAPARNRSSPDPEQILAPELEHFPRVAGLGQLI